MNLKTINLPILLSNFSGDEEILLDMINIFEHALSSLINPIRESIANQDRDQLRINAHTFKGIMKGFYMDAGSKMAHELEQRGIDDNFKGAFVTLNSLEDQLMIFLYELQILKKELYQIS